MVTCQDFIHPGEEQARRQMEALPGFQAVPECFLESGPGKMIHGFFMAEKIRMIRCGNCGPQKHEIKVFCRYCGNPLNRGGTK